MAQRYGGKYSPQSGEGYPGVAPDRVPQPASEPRHPLAKRPGWLIAMAIPFLGHAFGNGPDGLVRGLGAFALIAGGVFLLREGLRAEAAWSARRVARRPAIPRKIFGSVTVGLGLALGAQAPEMGLAGAITVGVVGAALSLAAFGLDPLRDKGMEGVDSFQQDRVARAVTEGEKHLREMREAIARANDGLLSARVERFGETARQLFRAVEQDPGDLAAARRYMGVYLEGARDATVKFADLWAATRDPKARDDYEALLTDLEGNFTARTRSLIEGGREGLEIEIDVLRERLAREGITGPRD
ncbi:5-bromo-4-chloroindolyl phosphate hydrolysis family protein [Paenirhodobacter sp.]|uniref:5-bromo-4-chloroindolyl phosphate hydrolysis family protein n=1 Tax=Paenirhodobacter sp. TaxID=1965326 RepID=UPI003B400D9A